MKIDIVNVPMQEEYEKFKQVCPNAREIIYKDGNKSLVVEKDGVELFRLDFMPKGGHLSERDILVVKNWGLIPNNVEQIVEAYNRLMPDKIDLSKKEEQEKSYYKVNLGLPYFKKLISEIKELNPDVQIDGQWIVRDHGPEKITIVSSIPLEQLNMSTFHFDNPLGKYIFSESKEEYLQNLTWDYFLNFNVSQATANSYADELRSLNPNVSISIEYDEENKNCKINSSIPLDKLNYPRGGGFGLDKDGYVAYLDDKVVDYKIGDDIYSNKRYIENYQHYFGTVSYKKMLEKMLELEKKNAKEQTNLKSMEYRTELNQYYREQLEKRRDDILLQYPAFVNVPREIKEEFKLTVEMIRLLEIGIKSAISGPKMTEEGLVIDLSTKKSYARCNEELLNIQNQNGIDIKKHLQPTEEKTQQQSQSIQFESGLQTLKINPQQELAKMAREKRKFTILQRERAMSEAQKGKNRSAIAAGLCILGGVAVTYFNVNFNGQNIQQVLQHELNAIYSWEALGQYIQDLGPLTTLLSACAGGFISKYLKHSKKFKQAQNEFIDFNNSLETVIAEELGGNKNAKSR
jgi:hypothetical protein